MTDKRFVPVNLFRALSDMPRFDSPPCSQVDPDLYFVEKGGQTKPAKDLCVQCADRIECLNWAMENNEPYGVWGGLTARERSRIRGAANGRAA